MELPVTLVIKAPNQRIGDQTVDCMLDWTVRKLKQHLTNVYPSKPNEKQQKLIYSGKLLQDHLTLKEVLRQHEDGSNKHTVHLVCAASSQTDTRSAAFSHRMESHNSHSRQSSSSSSQSSPEMEGLRYRGYRNPSPSPSVSSDTQNMFNAYSPQMPTMDQFTASMSQMGAAPPMDAAMFAGMMSGAGGMAAGAAMGYSPEQYLWLQQMYAQYMAQYMQYYQQAGYQVPPNTPVTPQSGTPPQNAPENGNQQQDNAAEDIDDLDEEFRQRDWLDYLYMFSRLMVLLGIVYFYSNMTRFLMVAAFFFVVYAYQMGWFYLQRRREQQLRQQEEVNGQNEQNIPQRQDNEQQNEQEDSPDAAAAEGNLQQAEGPAPQSPQPGALQVSWTFVSTFFTSLFPTPPPAINAN